MKKLKLNNLKVKSFATSLEDKEASETVKGGRTFGACTLGVCTLGVCTLGVCTLGVCTLGLCSNDGVC